eukprot:COSAG06_NODE_46469_length_346_cov_1.481781_1_plen_42_part_10
MGEGSPPAPFFQASLLRLQAWADGEPVRENNSSLSPFLQDKK